MFIGAIEQAARAQRFGPERERGSVRDVEPRGERTAESEGIVVGEVRREVAHRGNVPRATPSP